MIERQRAGAVLLGFRLLRLREGLLRLLLAFLVLQEAAEQVRRLLREDPLRRPPGRVREHLGQIQAGAADRSGQVDPEARADVLLEVGVRLDHPRRHRHEDPQLHLLVKAHPAAELQRVAEREVLLPLLQLLEPRGKLPRLELRLVGFELRPIVRQLVLVPLQRGGILPAPPERHVLVLAAAVADSTGVTAGCWATTVS